MSHEENAPLGPSGIHNRHRELHQYHQRPERYAVAVIGSLVVVLDLATGHVLLAALPASC